MLFCWCHHCKSDYIYEYVSRKQMHVFIYLTRPYNNVFCSYAYD